MQYASPNISETRLCLDFVPGIYSDTLAALRVYLIFHVGRLSYCMNTFDAYILIGENQDMDNIQLIKCGMVLLIHSRTSSSYTIKD